MPRRKGEFSLWRKGEFFIFNFFIMFRPDDLGYGALSGDFSGLGLGRNLGFGRLDPNVLDTRTSSPSRVSASPSVPTGQVKDVADEATTEVKKVLGQ